MGFDGIGRIACRIRPRSSSRGTNAGAQNKRANAIYHFAARLHAAQPTALQRDKSRPNDDRKRTCTRPWSRRDSRERHSARRYTRRRFRRRYLSPPKDDSIRPNRNVGRHRRHGHRNRLAALMNRRRSSVCIPHPHACLPAKDDQTSIELNCALQDRIAADRNMGAHAGHRRTPKRAVWNFCWHTE